MSTPPPCACGNQDLLPFSPGYRVCRSCETLVVARMPEPEALLVSDDEQDFYGRRYWFEHQEKELGEPSILVRARADLPERCLHWLRTLLRYRLPPATVLELGSGHGGFVALLRQAGFEATGLDLSPWVVDFARRTFGVPVLQGPLETQPIADGSLDVIALMDVLEHLRDPAEALRHCLRCLKADGILLIQTPAFPAGATYEGLQAARHPFLALLQEGEHLHLLSTGALRSLLQRVGATELCFEPAMFAQYDMCVVASQAPLPAAPAAAEIEAELGRTPQGRLLQALLDLDDRSRELLTRLAAVEADRDARLAVIGAQGARLGELEGERNALEAERNVLRTELAAANADRAARLAVIEQQGDRLGAVEGERNALRYQLDDVERKLAGAEFDRSELLRLVEAQQQRLADQEQALATLRTELSRLRGSFLFP
jgi:SAM-dependent methyltransferase